MQLFIVAYNPQKEYVQDNLQSIKSCISFCFYRLTHCMHVVMVVCSPTIRS